MKGKLELDNKEKKDSFKKLCIYYFFAVFFFPIFVAE